MNKTGFGFLRLPQNENKEIEYEVLNTMVDAFIDQGGTYFDTAYTYLNGKSEEALRKAVVERYPLDQIVIADKLPGWMLKKEEDNLKYFNEQLERCGVDYFDVYLIHWLNDKNYQICEKYHQFEFLKRVKEEGKAHKIGFSYHDSPELLEEILIKHPEVDYVQLQINYLDWNSSSLRAKELYDICCKYHKEVVVMEPVKGGSLVNLPEDVKEALIKFNPYVSIASWAIRFVTSLPQVSIVLSGMNTLEQMNDNMQDFKEMNDDEFDLLMAMADWIRSNTAIPCTACGYCLKNCPKHIPIPSYFALYNDYARNPGEDWKMEHVYHDLVKKEAAASSCIECKMCERNCPQKIQITDFLKKVVEVFE